MRLYNFRYIISNVLHFYPLVREFQMINDCWLVDLLIHYELI